MRSWKKIVLITFLLIATYLIVDVGRYFIYPNVASLKKSCPKKTAFMKYREKVWQEQGIKRKITNIWVPLSMISPYVMKAVIIAEDDKFWSHEGFDFEAMQKALAKDIKKKKFRVGGSTISQQLVKNLYLQPEKSLIRKMKEAIITWRVERTLGKKRIIELYLNVAEWGDGLFGVEAAARYYYGKPALYLTAAEAARLAVMLPNPIKYQHLPASRYLENRSAAIYRIMVRRGLVIPEFEAVMGEADQPAPLTASPEAEPGVAGDLEAEAGKNGRQD